MDDADGTNQIESMKGVHRMIYTILAAIGLVAVLFWIF